MRRKSVITMARSTQLDDRVTDLPAARSRFYSTRRFRAPRPIVCVAPATTRFTPRLSASRAPLIKLGLRLDGEQVDAGVRFLEIVRDEAYDVMVGNPPYQGTSKLAEADWFKRNYPRAKADLYACFLER